MAKYVSVKVKAIDFFFVSVMKYRQSRVNYFTEDITVT